MSSIATGFILGNLLSVELNFDRLDRRAFQTEYHHMVEKHRRGTGSEEKKEVMLNIIRKGEEQDLSSIELLMLTEISPIEELKVHG